MYWIGIAGEYFRGLMIFINNMTVGSFLFPAKGAQFGSLKAREFKIIRTEKFLEVTYDIWLTLANFLVNDMPMIYRSGYWLFCSVSIPPSHGNIYYRFLWEATLPPSYPCVSWGWIHRNGSSWGGHTALLIRAQHPPKHSNETEPEQGLKSDRWDLSQIFIGSRGKNVSFFPLDLLRH